MASRSSLSTHGRLCGRAISGRWTCGYAAFNASAHSTRLALCSGELTTSGLAWGIRLGGAPAEEARAEAEAEEEEEEAAEEAAEGGAAPGSPTCTGGKAGPAEARAGLGSGAGGG